ncbi:histone-lysine N-methyltransferase SMYD3 isoform X1 [Apis laboriosa]|uniref:histone-lysine N-methyltransferase SMYD3 isoform X1 n=2 Tax=Apis laboriosa TaxID=183418 RepID=UPI001CC7218C|nr:histone-lysine N-methyltransferase SMYD3 isoform X1 [Apis laboriosa]XP_043795263.1 histone-lysine N-methyltransferase SMYD3 isoform X1 [Apis laboriosa]
MSESENFIKKGTTLFTAKPFAYVLYSKYRNERCDYCFKSGKLFRCSVCKCIYYCNQSCQQMSWTIHSKECASLKRFSSKVIPDVARLMARIIIKLNQGGGEEIGYYSKTKYRKFKDLMSHYSDIKKDEKKMEHFVCVCGVLYEFLGDMSIPNSAELMGIYGRIYINSFNISDLDMNNIGAGIYLGPSILDHSCKPNAVATFEGTTIIIRTTEDLPYLDLSQIRISYIDVIKTTKDRREELQSSYYFWCKCKKCEESEPMVEAAACPNKFCTYPCSLDADMCENCNTKFPENFKETFYEISDLTAYHLQNMKNIAYLDVSTMCLKKQEGVLHPLNIQHVQTLQSAFDSSLTLQHWEEAESYAKRLINGYLTYYGEFHPSTGILYLSIGKLQVYLKKLKQAIETLRKANAILTITHGEQHTVIEHNLKPLLYQATVEEFNES